MSELYEKMLEEEKADRVTRFVHPDIPGLIGFNYTPECQFSKAWNDINIQAILQRGKSWYRHTL